MKLTPDEWQTLEGIKLGMTSPQCAKKLGISTGAMAKRRFRLRLLFNAKNDAHLVSLAYQDGTLMCPCCRQ